jgi:hypothetical protein
MAFNEIKDNVENLKSETKAYVDKNVEYYKLLGFKIVAKTTTMFVSYTLILLAFAFVLLFGSIAAGFAIGNSIGSTALGFLIIAGAYLIIGIFFLLLKDKLLESRILRIFSEMFFND